MPKSRDVAVLIGSLRKDSFTRKVARATIALAPRHLKFRFVDIARVGYYNQDLDGDEPPMEWRVLRNEIKASDAVLFATPEYNRSVPGVLKNAIDIASRPPGKSAFGKKPAAVLSVSPGKIGGFGANHHLRQSLMYLGMPAMAQPEAYIGGAGDLVDEAGHVRDDGTRKFLEDFITAFAEWIELTSPSEATFIGDDVEAPRPTMH